MDTISVPHADIELGVKRSPLAYVSCTPDEGMDADTGLILYIGGYGMDPRDSYTQRLLAHLANKYNCVAATPEYFGAGMMAGRSGRIVPHPDFFKKITEHYGLVITAPKEMEIDQLLDGLTKVLAGNGVSRLHVECTLLNDCEEYNSMGLLPALDGLQLMHHLLKALPLNKKRLFALGTSYGAYIAGMMAKFAPHTFRMVVDNSGFSSAADDQPGLLGWRNVNINGVTILCRNLKSWSIDPRLANFFSMERQAIRNLMKAEHVHDNTARIYAYHAATDTIAPTEQKIRLRAAYKDHLPYELCVIDDSQIDGRIFKNLNHGMNASMRGIFELSYAKYIRDGGALAEETDFDRESRYVFPCGKEDYVLKFSREQGVRAQIRAA